jgi:hypothetical protein
VYSAFSAWLQYGVVNSWYDVVTSCMRRTAVLFRNLLQRVGTYRPLFCCLTVVGCHYFRITDVRVFSAAHCA